MSTPRYRETEIDDLLINRIIENDWGQQLSSSYYNPTTTNEWSSPISVATVKRGSFSSILDRVTPNFHVLRKQGVIINNPLSINNVSEVDTMAMFSYTRLTNYYMRLASDPSVLGIYPYKSNSRSGYVPIYLLIAGSGKDFLDLDSEIDTEILKARAISKAWANINESDLLVLASIGESTKTARDLQTLARKSIKVFKALKNPATLKNLSPKRLRTYAREAEELYMQARYNLRPMYYDILGTMKIVSGIDPYYRRKRNARDRYTVRGSASDSVSASDTTVFQSTYLPGVNLKLTRTSTLTVEARAGVLCQAGEMTRWEQSGVHLLPETAWELIPGSFIVDWFSNVGDVIGSWTPKPGINPLTSWVTTKRTYTQQLRLEFDSYTDTPDQPLRLGQIFNTETTCGGIEGSVTRTTVQKNRFPNPGKPYMPHFDVSMTLPKSLDLAIIGKNLFKAAKKSRL